MVEVSQTHLVDPHHGALVQTVVIRVECVVVFVGIPHPYHDHDYVRQVGISLDREASIILRIHGLVFLEERVPGGPLDLQVLKLAELDVDVVLSGPNEVLVACVPRRDLHRDFVLVVVVLEIVAQSDEARHVIVVEGRAIRTRLGVDIHAQALVHPHVEIDVAVCTARIAIFQSANGHFQRLLIQTALVRGPYIDFTDDARRRHIWDRFPVSVFFDVDRTDGKRSGRRVIGLNLLWTREGLQVATPFSSNQFQASKTQCDRLRPPLHKHSDEPDGSEIRNSAHAVIELPHGNLELVPTDGPVLVIGRGHHLLERVGDVVATDIEFSQVLRAQRHLVLEIAFDRGKRNVLVDVLRVRNGRGGYWVTVGRSGVGVVLVPVEPLVPLQDGFFVGLGLRISEVPEIIRRRIAHVFSIRLRGHPIRDV